MSEQECGAFRAGTVELLEALGVRNSTETVRVRTWKNGDMRIEESGAASLPAAFAARNVAGPGELYLLRSVFYPGMAPTRHGEALRAVQAGMQTAPGVPHLDGSVDTDHLTVRAAHQWLKHSWLFGRPQVLVTQSPRHGILRPFDPVPVCDLALQRLPLGVSVGQSTAAPPTEERK